MQYRMYLLVSILLLAALIWLLSARFFGNLGSWFIDKLCKPFYDANKNKGEN